MMREAQVTGQGASRVESSMLCLLGRLSSFVVCLTVVVVEVHCLALGPMIV